MWAALAHARRHGIDAARWSRGIELTIDYLVSSWQRPCYDWWEMHIEEIHISTLGSVAAGLRDASREPFLDAARSAAAAGTADAIGEFIRRHGIRDGHLIKWVGSDQVDASLAALVGLLDVIEPTSPLGLATHRRARRPARRRRRRAPVPRRHLLRRRPVAAAQLHARPRARGAPGTPTARSRCCAGRPPPSAPTGSMPEQVADHLLDPSFVAEWVERWGPSADPLLWSSAMFLRLAVELGVVEPTAIGGAALGSRA